MNILAPSILAADLSRLADVMGIAQENGADYFHVDIMDGSFVPNLSFGVPVTEAVRRSTDKPVDVHLMIEKPERYIEKFHDAGADMITVHIEACKPLDETIEKIHSLGMRAGISVKPGTGIDEFTPFLEAADMFLIMTVEPGFGGQKYMEGCTDKIKALRRLLSERGLNKDIQVDGGITRDNIRTVLDAGANVIVMGSSVFKGNIKENMEFFRKVLDENDKRGF